MITISVKELLIYILLGCGIIAVVELIVLLRKIFPLFDPLTRTLEDVSVIVKEATLRLFLAKISLSLSVSSTFKDSAIEPTTRLSTLPELLKVTAMCRLSNLLKKSSIALESRPPTIVIPFVRIP